MSELHQKLARRRCLNGEVPIVMESLVAIKNTAATDVDGSIHEQADESSRDPSSSFICQECEKPESMAVVKCTSCQTFFCSKCARSHRVSSEERGEGKETIQGTINLISSEGTDVERSPGTLSDEMSETSSIVHSVETQGVRVQKDSIPIKRHKIIIQKLTLELASLREALEETQYSDVQTLHTKLRASSLDLRRIKSLNLELKDRIQTLEV